MEHKPLKVSATTKPSSLAGAIVKTLKEGVEHVQVVAIGDAANHQMNKALAVSNQFLAPSGQRLDIVPSFGTLEDAEKEITTIAFFLRLRNM